MGGCCSEGMLCREQGAQLTPHPRAGSWAASSTWGPLSGDSTHLLPWEAAVCPAAGLLMSRDQREQVISRMRVGAGCAGSWLVPRAPVPSLPLPLSPYQGRAEAASGRPAVEGGVCSVGMSTQRVFCSCISRCLVKKNRGCPAPPMGTTVGAGGVSQQCVRPPGASPHPSPGTLLTSPGTRAWLCPHPRSLCHRHGRRRGSALPFHKSAGLRELPPPANSGRTLLLNLPSLGACWDSLDISP